VLVGRRGSRDRVRDHVTEALGDEAGVLVVDGEGGPWPEAATAA
jgi:hypothetical protein